MKDVTGLTDGWVATQADAKRRRKELLQEGHDRGIVPDLVSEERANEQCRFEPEEIPENKEALLRWLNENL